MLGVPPLESRPTVAVVVVVHNRLEFTRKCLGSLGHASQKAELKVIVVDDGSSDGTSEWLKANVPGVTVLRGDGNLWFGGGNQKAIEYVKEAMPKADYLMTLNNDTTVLPGCIDALVEESQGEATVGAILLNSDRTRIHCFGAFWNPWRGWVHSMTGQGLADHPELGRGVSRSSQMLNTTCTLIPMKWIKRVQGINVAKYPQNKADTDLLCKISRSGSPLRVTSRAVATNDSDTDRKDLSIRRMGLVEFLQKSLVERTSPIHLPSAIQSVWETAPTRLQALPVLTRMLMIYGAQMGVSLVLCLVRPLRTIRST